MYVIIYSLSKLCFCFVFSYGTNNHFLFQKKQWTQQSCSSAEETAQGCNTLGPSLSGLRMEIINLTTNKRVTLMELFFFLMHPIICNSFGKETDLGL